jgi:hypothetical protein
MHPCHFFSSPFLSLSRVVGDAVFSQGAMNEKLIVGIIFDDQMV